MIVPNLGLVVDDFVIFSLTNLRHCVVILNVPLIIAELNKEGSIMWWGYHHGFFPWFFFPFGFLMFFFLCFFVIRVILFRRFRRTGAGCWGSSDGRLSAEDILKRRLARGEVTEEEFQRIKDKLKE